MGNWQPQRCRDDKLRELILLNIFALLKLFVCRNHSYYGGVDSGFYHARLVEIFGPRF